MHTTLLVVLHQGQQLASVFADHRTAWAALLRFVDQSWPIQFGQRPPPDDEEERVKAFFHGDDMYVLADANVDLVDHPLLRERGLTDLPCCALTEDI